MVLLDKFTWKLTELLTDNLEKKRGTVVNCPRKLPGGDVKGFQLFRFQQSRNRKRHF